MERCYAVYSRSESEIHIHNYVYFQGTIPLHKCYSAFIFRSQRVLQCEDNDIIRIKQNLSKFKPKQQNVAEKRPLSEDMIKAIFNLPYDGKKVRGYASRHDLAKDCFILSFCLMGINSADLYNTTEFLMLR